MLAGRDAVTLTRKPYKHSTVYCTVLEVAVIKTLVRTKWKTTRVFGSVQFVLFTSCVKAEDRHLFVLLFAALYATKEQQLYFT